MDIAPIAQVGGIDTGDTAWMLAASALVLMMTIALGLFYEIGRASCRERV